MFKTHIIQVNLLKPLYKLLNIFFFSVKKKVTITQLIIQQMYPNKLMYIIFLLLELVDKFISFQLHIRQKNSFRTYFNKIKK